MLRTAVVIGLAALYETVEASSPDLPFALDADGCVVGYQPECAAQDVHHLCTITCAPHHLLTLTTAPFPRAQRRLLPPCAPCDDGRGRHLAPYRHQSRVLFILLYAANHTQTNLRCLPS